MYRPQKEERVNAATHALGIVLSLLATALLLPLVLRHPNHWLTITGSVYLLALLGVYTSSTLSHTYVDDRRRFFRMLDQAFIYLLIVASYTPFSILYLKGTVWSVLLGVMWILATAGFISKLFFAHKIQSVSIWLYVGLGWIPAFAGMPFHASFPTDCLILFFAGGVLYTSGILFLFNDKRVWYFHAIWHLMVIAGSATHFIAIYTSVIRTLA